MAPTPTPLELLRLRNLFGNMGQPSPTFPNDAIGGGASMPLPEMPMQQPQEQPYDVNARMGQLYTPETGATDRYNQMVQGYPTYQEPGKLRRIGGAILGSLTDLGTNLGGNRAGVRGTDVFNEATGRNDFERNVVDWKNKIGPAGTAAQLERYNNANERTLAYQTVNQELTQRKNESTAKNQEENTRIRQQRADVYQWKAEHPGMKIIAPKGGNIRGVDPISGKTIMDFGPTGTMTDADRLDLQQENALERISATGEENRRTEGVRQGGRETLTETKSWQPFNLPDGTSVLVNSATGELRPLKTPTGENAPTLGKPSGASSGGAQLPSQQRVKSFTNAQQIWNTRPDLRPYLELIPQSNDFRIKESKSWTQSGKNEDAQKIAELNRLLYPQQPNTPAVGGGGRGGGPGGRGGNTPNQAPKAPPGWHYERKPDGGWTAKPGDK